MLNLKYKNLYLLITILSIVIIAIILEIRNQTYLNDEGEITQFQVISIIEKRKGITTSETVVEIKYLANGEFQLNRIPYIKGLDEGKCYLLKYSVKRPKIVVVKSTTPQNCNFD